MPPARPVADQKLGSSGRISSERVRMPVSCHVQQNIVSGKSCPKLLAGFATVPIRVKGKMAKDDTGLLCSQSRIQGEHCLWPHRIEVDGFAVNTYQSVATDIPPPVQRANVPLEHVRGIMVSGYGLPGDGHTAPHMLAIVQRFLVGTVFRAVARVDQHVGLLIDQAGDGLELDGTSIIAPYVVVGDVPDHQMWLWPGSWCRVVQHVRDDQLGAEAHIAVLRAGKSEGAGERSIARNKQQAVVRHPALNPVSSGSGDVQLVPARNSARPDSARQQTWPVGQRISHAGSTPCLPCLRAVPRGFAHADRARDDVSAQGSVLASPAIGIELKSSAGDRDAGRDSRKVETHQ